MDDTRSQLETQPSSQTTASAVYELLIFTLTILSLVVIAGYFLLPEDDPTRVALYNIDILLSVVFLAD